MLVGNILRLWNVNGEAVKQTFAEVQQRAGATLADAQWRQGPALFHDVLSEVIVYPLKRDQPGGSRAEGAAVCRALLRGDVGQPPAARPARQHAPRPRPATRCCGRSCWA